MNLNCIGHEVANGMQNCISEFKCKEVDLKNEPKFTEIHIPAMFRSNSETFQSKL